MALGRLSQRTRFAAGAYPRSSLLRKRTVDLAQSTALNGLFFGEPLPWSLSADREPSGLTVNRASTATYLGKDGLLKTAQPNEARFDHLINGAYSAGTSALLIEPGTTNQAFASDNLTIYNSGAASGSAAGGGVTDPFGTTTATKITESATNDFQTIWRSDATTTAANQLVTAAVWLKAGTRGFGSLTIAPNNAANSFTIIVNLSTGAVTATNSYNSPTSTAYAVEAWPNGWFRVSVTANQASTATPCVYYFGCSNSGTPSTFSYAGPQYLGSGTDYIYAFGLQVEIGSKATSYVPYPSSAFPTGGVRAADVATTSLDNSLGGLAYTFDDASTQAVPAAGGSDYTIPTTLNRARISGIAASGPLRDASSPPYFALFGNGSTGTPVTNSSASFTPPAGALLTLAIAVNSIPPFTPTITPTTTSGSTSAWTQVARQDNGSGGAIIVFSATVLSSIPTVVQVATTATRSTACSTVEHLFCWIDVWTNHGGVGTSVTGTSTTTPINPTITTTGNNSRVAGAAIDWNANTTLSSSDLSDSHNGSGSLSAVRAYKASNTVAASTSVAVNMAASGTPQWTYALFEVRSVGGTSLSASITETAAANDNSDATVVRVVSITEAASAGDTLSAQANFSASVTEGATAGETSSASNTTSVSQTDSVTVGDSQDRTLITAAAATEAVTAGESSSAQAVFAASATEAATAGDSQSASNVTSASQTDAATAADSSSASAILNGSVTESVTATEQSSTGSLATGGVTETVTAAESSDRSIATSAASAEAAAASDAVFASFLTSASQTDAAIASDAAGAATVTNSSVTETVTAADAQSAANIATASITEAVTAVDAVSTAANFMVSITESVTATETSTGSTFRILAATITEAASASDSASTQVDFNATRTEAVTAIDTATASAILNATQVESVTASDLSSAFAQYVAAAVEVVAAADSTSASGVLTAAALETILAAEFSSFSVAYEVASVELIALADAADATVLHGIPSDSIYRIPARTRIYQITFRPRTFALPARDQTIELSERPRIFVLPSRQRTFIIPRGSKAMQLKNKPVSMDVDHIFDFSKWEWIVNGDTITGGSVEVIEGDVTASYVTHTTSSVTFRVSGGTSGTVCKVMVKGTTAGGNTLAEPADFTVID